MDILDGLLKAFKDIRAIQQTRRLLTDQQREELGIIRGTLVDILNLQPNVATRINAAFEIIFSP
jgi:hypothetical protein